MDKLRLDKWLWAARFYKTRSLAVEEIDRGRVRVNDQDAKPSREIKVGDTVALRQGAAVRTVVVRGISSQRGSAPQARLLYEETPESLQRQAAAAEQNRLANDPAGSQLHGRPTKRDRRHLEKTWDNKTWDSRWSASAD